jgi:ABC-type Fe3+ transport system substrate-binding protein
MLRSLIFAAWLGVIIPTPICAQATVPPPGADGVAVTAGVADQQATVVIYSTMDTVAAQPLIEGFREANPQIGVQYLELNSIDLYERFLAEIEAGRPSADLLLSSAMDLQLKLANDGYALAYSSAATSQLPDWAVWRNEAFGFTFEPVAIVYNKDLVPPEEVPSTRYELAQLLQNRPEAYFGKVATYDPERSGFGFLLITQDAQQSPEIWDLVRSFGESKVKLYSTTAAILDRIASGTFLIGYNLVGSYGRARAAIDPSIGIILPKDYTLVMSRIALIPKAAPRPRLAGLFLDFMLSKAGQQIVAGASQLYSIHPEVTGEATAASLRASEGSSLKPIQVGPGLLVYLDQAKRQKFLKQWQRALAGR